MVVRCHKNLFKYQNNFPLPAKNIQNYMKYCLDELFDVSCSASESNYSSGAKEEDFMDILGEMNFFQK